MSRNLAVESEQLLIVVRTAAVNHEARYYMLRKNRAEDMRRRVIVVARSTTWALARNEAGRWIRTAIPTVLPLLLGVLVTEMIFR